MAIQTYVGALPQVLLGFGTTFSPVLSGTLAISTDTGTAKTWLLGGLRLAKSISTESGCLFSSTTVVTITPLDPPFPPVNPPFSTELIYGRDHLSLNLLMVRGDTYQFDIAVTNNGTAVDLTGMTIRFTAKRNVRDADVSAVIALSTATTGISVLSATAGTARITIPSSATTGLAAHKVELPYDIQLVDSSSNVFTVTRGVLTIVPDVTVTTP